ncbi:MAG: DUF1109 domain-containing protein [Pseudomonadota bacterium]
MKFVARFPRGSIRPARHGLGDTAELVERLAADVVAVEPWSVAQNLVSAVLLGAAVSLALVLSILGIRPDFAHALSTPMFWVKLVYVLGVGVIGLCTVERLARPGGLAQGRARWLLIPVAAILALAATQLDFALPKDRSHLLLGGSASVCSLRILFFSLPPLAGLIMAVRGLAPTRLGLAGAAIGLAAGGFGAAAYALSCPEAAGPFVAVWYSLGMVAAGAVGALIGPLALRW